MFDVLEVSHTVLDQLATLESKIRTRRKSLADEIGRAGRDGVHANAVLLFDPADAKLQRFFQGGRYPSAEDLVNAHHALKRLSDRPDQMRSRPSSGAPGIHRSRSARPGKDWAAS